MSFSGLRIRLRSRRIVIHRVLESILSRQGLVREIMGFMEDILVCRAQNELLCSRAAGVSALLGRGEGEA